MNKQMWLGLTSRLNTKAGIRCSLLILLLCGIAATWLFVALPRVVEAQGGGGRLVISNTSNIFVINADPAIQQNTFNVAASSGFAQSTSEFPSVSAQTGRIAYASRRGNEGSFRRRIYAMDSDGSNPRQLTNAVGINPAIEDTAPVISPDGTKIAFISSRFAEPTFLDGTPKQPEVFVINFDGTGLYQVTASEQSPNGTATVALSVAWDSGGALYVSAKRVVMNMNGQMVASTGIYTFNVDGTGQNRVVELGNFDLLESLDVSANNLLFVHGNNIIVGSGQNFTLITPEQAGLPRYGAGGVRFSPDGSRIVYSSDEGNGSIKTINLDGSNPITVRSNLGNTNAMWWMPGPPIPTPARLEMAPPMLIIPNDGSTRQATPTLYDTNDNVIFRSASYSILCDATHPCSNIHPANTFEWFQDGQIHVRSVGNPTTGVGNFCGTNGGMTGCNTVVLGLNFAEVLASVPTANTNGAGGPGIFTVRRVPGSTQAGSPLPINFTLGGDAVRDLDYALNLNGNSFIMPTGQATFDILVTPLRAMGNKTVTLSIQAPSGADYTTFPGRDTANVNIVDNGLASSALTLSSVTPDQGGNGGLVFATVYGLNIRPGASVRLARAGHSDVVGANVSVATDGASAIAAMDLNGRAQGLWDVVVRNTDNTEARLNNGFTIATNNPARIQVQVQGPEVLNLSQREVYYNVVYTNIGNVDAFGVFMLISGVYLRDHPDGNGGGYTTIRTEIAPVQDIPGEDPFPDYVHQMPNIFAGGTFIGSEPAGRIPLFIPRIPANSSRVFSFKLRFPDMEPNPAEPTISASALPPLFLAVNTTNTATGFGLSPNENIYNDAGVNCATALIDAALNCSGVLPGGNCLTAIVSTAASVVNGGLNYSSGGHSTAGDVALGGGMIGGIIMRGLACAGSLTGLTQIYAAITCMNSLYGAYNSCLDAYHSLHTRRVTSRDPNEKIGVRGLTEQNYVTTFAPLRYGISFENEPTATAPAQDVVVTDQLDISKVDLTTFSLSQISFGDTVITVPPGLKAYATEVDLRPANDLLVRVNAALNQSTGLVTWTFQSLDPFTRQPPTDPLAGFLPPNILGTEGQGKMLFSIAPKSTVTAGAEIRNHARIVFDTNPPIDTNEWLNTVDDSKPVSQVAALAAIQNTVSFPVNWSGTDTGAGVAHYTIYVSDNGGPFTIWLYNASATSGTFTGQPGRTYSFYSIATDGADNREDAPATADATTMTPCPTITVNPANATLPAGQAGMQYNQTFTQSGGDGTTTFIISAGALPNGLSLSTGGELSGAPTAIGNFSFTVKATDVNGCFGTQAYALMINPPCGTITVSPTTLLNGLTGVSYAQTLSATGGSGLYTFSLQSGGLPAGLNLNGNMITGTPTTAGSSTFTIRTTDDNDCLGERSYTVVIGSSGLMYYPLAHPVRLLDTRPGASPNTCSQPNAQIAGGTSFTQAARGTCDGINIPANITTITGHVTTVQASGNGFLMLYPSDAPQPVVANSIYLAGETLNNAFTVGLGAADGAFKIFVTSTTHAVVDVTGYYAPPMAGGLYFHPLPKPIRLLETRQGFSGCQATGAQLLTGSTRLQTGVIACDGVEIPAGAQALVGNATTTNSQSNGYLTLFPANAARPTVASSNFVAGINRNAPFTVGLSLNGEFNIYTAATTDLVIDVMGYFSAQANDANGQGLLFNSLGSPLRLLDTRAGQSACYTPGAQMTGGTVYTQDTQIPCTNLTATARALVGNVATVNATANGYLTFWPSNATQPTTATSNYQTGRVLNRHFTVGLGADGAFKRLSSKTTDLVIDVSGYFAP